MIRIKREVIDCLCNWITSVVSGFSFEDAKVSKKKDAMLMLSFCLFSKEKLYLGQLDGVLRDLVPAIGDFLEVLGSRGLLKIYQKNIR